MKWSCLLMLAAVSGLAQAPEKPLYLDSSQPVERRLRDLRGRMSLKEKVGQMNMPCVYLAPLGRTPEDKQEGCRRFTVGTLTEDIGPG
jgi:beta-glucosidase